jgi:hypothetical protein
MRYILALAGIACAFHAGAARAEVQDCIEITAVPAIISQQGVHCFKQDLATSITSGNAITVSVPNVVIELNGYKLGGLAGGSSSQAYGIHAVDRQNVTIRNGTIRGFNRNIFLEASGDDSGSTGHLVEQIRSERALFAGIMAEGRNVVLRDNFIYDTGNSGIGTTAHGIIAQQGAGFSITGNIVSGIAETTSANGISVNSAPNSFISDNQIRKLSANTMRGIAIVAADRTIIMDNILQNEAFGGNGIVASGASEVCIRNVVANFSVSFSGCEVLDGNVGL